MLLSIIVPSRNEEHYIENCVNSIIKALIIFKESEKEILIIDGNSTDKTVQKIKYLVKKFKFIKILSNKKKTAPAALNIGVKNSSGKYIFRCDAHAFYPKNYFINCLKVIKSSNKDVMNVGGVIRTVNKNKSLFGQTITLILSNKVGVGNSAFRTFNVDGKKVNTSRKNFIKTNTVPFGCFKREVFKKIGLFNENEPGNEDLEFNKRIIKSNFKILLVPKIFSLYYSREKISSFFSQLINNGAVVTRPKEVYFHNIRHYVPLFFFFFLVASVLNAIFFNYEFLITLTKAILSLYLIVIMYGSLINLFRSRKISIFISSFFLFFIVHLLYGFGSFIGLFKFSKLYQKYNNYDEFLTKVFPIKNPFLRDNQDYLTNFIKLFALRIAFIFHNLNITANLLGYSSSIILLIGIYFFYISLFSYVNILLLGFSYFLFGLIMFFDFIDGSLARAQKNKFLFGDLVDNFNPDLLRIFLILSPGILLKNIEILILFFFSAITQSIIFYKTKDKIYSKFKIFFKFYSLLHGLRFLYLILLPILLILFFGNYSFFSIFVTILAVIYFLFNFSLFLMCSKIRK